MNDQAEQVALLFPGQGSQHVGMLSNLPYPEIASTFAEASEALGYDLWEITQSNPDDRLNQTATTQPALLAAGVAMWRLWQSLGWVPPSMLAGHSLGEYTALVCSGAIAFSDALTLVEKRGQLMQAAVPDGVGAMVAVIGLTDEAVITLCNQYHEADAAMYPANFNAPGQVVVAGHAKVLDAFTHDAKVQGAKLVKRLPMSVPSHCPLMASAASEFALVLDPIAIHPPKIKVIHNVTVDTCDTPEAIKPLLCQQLHQPVRWTQTIHFLHKNGITRLCECGPGKVLTGLNKRILKAMPCTPLSDAEVWTASKDSD